MGKVPEYISPWADQQPTDPQKLLRATEALSKLVMRFLVDPQQKAATVEEKTEATRRLNAMLTTYFSLSVRAAADGIKGDDAKKFVKEGLIAGGFIDATDSVKATEDFAIISEGYELNNRYWNEKIGRGRKFINDLKDLPRS